MQTPTEERKPLSIEELLLPRYKVSKEGYPNMPFEPEQILVLSEFDGRAHLAKGEFYYAHTNTTFHEGYLKKFPSIFQPLQWWEEREEWMMPEYVKNVADHHVFKVTKHFKGSGFPFGLHDRNYFLAKRMRGNYSDFVPATREEYESQQSLPHLKREVK